MKKLTAEQAIKSAEQNRKYVFIDIAGDEWSANKIINWSNNRYHRLVQVQPFTAHRLVPVDSDERSRNKNSISKEAAKTIEKMFDAHCGEYPEKEMFMQNLWFMTELEAQTGDDDES
jgi:hypothetical protein